MVRQIEVPDVLVKVIAKVRERVAGVRTIEEGGRRKLYGD